MRSSRETQSERVSPLKNAGNAAVLLLALTYGVQLGSSKALAQSNADTQQSPSKKQPSERLKTIGEKLREEMQDWSDQELITVWEHQSFRRRSAAYAIVKQRVLCSGDPALLTALEKALQNTDTEVWQRSAHVLKVYYRASEDRIVAELKSLHGGFLPPIDMLPANYPKRTELIGHVPWGAHTMKFAAVYWKMVLVGKTERFIRNELTSKATLSNEKKIRALVQGMMQRDLAEKGITTKDLRPPRPRRPNGDIASPDRQSRRVDPYREKAMQVLQLQKQRR